MQGDDGGSTERGLLPSDWQCYMVVMEVQRLCVEGSPMVVDEVIVVAVC